MEIKASLKNYAQAPRKARLVANLLRGKKVPEALTTLAFTTKRAASAFEKLLKGAVANALHNKQLPAESLRIKELRVDKGIVLKRSMPRAQGRSSPLRKRRSHLTLVLESV